MKVRGDLQNSKNEGKTPTTAETNAEFEEIFKDRK
jgi:hypothetical protein